jgi:hypothetical protein
MNSHEDLGVPQRKQQSIVLVLLLSVPKFGARIAKRSAWAPRIITMVLNSMKR